jgi:hypothetical protein
MAACTSKSKSVEGSWTSPIDGMDIFQAGFTLNADGSAKSINMATLLYRSWKKKGSQLYVTGESLGNGQVIPFTDTFSIADEGGKTILRSGSGKSFSLADSTRVSQLVSEYETMYCYSLPGGKDFVDLRYMRAGDAIMGSLTYKIEGKDANMGNIIGSIRGDTLDATYTFFSEDIKSVRQVVFLKNGSGWIQGNGEVVMDSTERVYFKNPGGLDFSKGFNLQQVVCQ